MKISFGDAAKFELKEGWCQKGYQTRSLTPALALKLAGFRLTFRSNVKKIPNGRLQGLDAAPKAFGGVRWQRVQFCPFRLKKSRK